ncbi:MAG: hypothetical protein Q4F79_12750 [Eubacteriales bacterium]|nr:hypothetical protein [Eubacteriales bacterium]
MNAEEMLKAYRANANELKSKIRRKEKQLEEAKDRQVRFGETYDNRVNQLKKELLNLNTEIHRLDDETYGIIEALPNPNAQKVLQLRYIEGKPWKDIGNTMFYSIRWTQKLHRQAMQQLKMNERQKKGGRQHEERSSDLGEIHDYN